MLPLGTILYYCGSIYWAIRLQKTAFRLSLQAGKSQGTVDAHEIRASRVQFSRCRYKILPLLDFGNRCKLFKKSYPVQNARSLAFV